jgi:hypothetical protein
VHTSQNAFVKGRVIHDSFKLVQAAAKALHLKTKASLLLKVDVTQAFDSVSWSFLLEVLWHMGFLSGRIGWVSILLSSVSTRVLLNGSPGARICHGCNLWQGDSLSPMLFLLVMEVLGALFHKADQWAVLQHLGVCGIPFQALLYVDDVIFFLSLVPGDLQITRTIFDLFQEASCLACNLGKCQFSPICCSKDQLMVVTDVFLCLVVNFPVKYLGILLALGKLPRSALEPIVEKVANALLAWKRRLMHKSKWLSLIRSTLSAMPIYMDISLHLPPWLQKALVKIFKAFLWTDTDII